MVNYINQRFGYLTPIERIKGTRYIKAKYKCICDCGNITYANTCDLTSGKVRSCGCRIYESHNKTHGMTHTEIYKRWLSMKQRCYDKNHKTYSRYGKNGITVCDEWMTFIPFYEWSMSHGYKEGLSLDRIDNTKGYSPDNCRWVTIKEQANNRRNNIVIMRDGIRYTLTTYCEANNLKYSRVLNRMHRGLPFEEAIKNATV